MNITLPIYKRASLLLAIACLCVVNTYGQNTPVLTETAPAGNVLPFDVPPALPGQAEGVGYNYIRTFMPTVPITNAQDIIESSPAGDVRISTTFKDGFYRDMQTVVRNFTNSAKPHLVIPVDTRFQLNGFRYLPYATASDNSINADPLAGYRNQAFQEQKDYYLGLYPGEGYTAFSGGRSISDANQRSAISLSEGKSQVGQDRGTTSKAIMNNASEIRIWELDGSGLPVSAGFYPADQLYGSLSTSTEGSTVAAYKDKEGKMICQIVYLENNTVAGGGVVPVYGTTYYVYDKKNRLCYTIPPKATDLISAGTLTQTQLNDLCYQYRYNADGLLIEKQDPGKAIEEYVYDKRKRLVHYRDAILRGQNRWAFTIYDVLDRVICTGVCESADTRQTVQGYLDDNISYQEPNILSYQKNYQLYGVYPTLITNSIPLAYTYYDDYAFSDPTGALWNTYSDVLQFTEQLSVPGAETAWISKRTKGKVTGSKVKILPGPYADPAKTGEWRQSTVFYDEQGRAFYTVGKDLYQGNPIHSDYTGVQYDFSSRPLITKHVIENTNSNGAVTHRELSRNFYDPLSGRLTQTKRKTDNGAWQIQSTANYDELGRITRAVIGNFGEVQDYNYNIRNQLAGINGYYARTGDRQSESKTFGELLQYDYGFTQPRTDGHVAGMVWRGAGSAAPNAYGYSYDYAGRLTLADYRRYEPPSGSFFSYAWRKDLADYTVSNLKYDKNGNIKNMDQRSVKNGTLVTMDQLTYNYSHNQQSNQLQSVSDNAPFYDLGDFNNLNAGSNDYDYDPNGNLKQDLNKGIGSVTYNYLNRSEVIDMGSGKKIAYSYDAGGNKVQELIIRPGQPDKRIDYVGNFIYQNDSLQYALTAEGRSVYNPINERFKEEYFVKDHLGNVRSVIDLFMYPVQEYLATYEIASANLEGLFFDHHDEVRDDKPGGTTGDNKAGNLDGSDPNRRIGTSMLLKVMAGDKLEMNVNNFYENYEKDDDNPVNAEDMLSSVISTLTGGAGGFQGSESHNTKLVNDAFTWNNYGTYNQLINSTTNANQPKAYLNYIFYDERMQLVPELSGAFQANGNGTWTQIGTSTPIEINKNGYLAVYLSNASRGVNCALCSHVFFDQLILRFSRGTLKEESHYYPHGLPIAGMGSAASGFTENKRKYQGNEYIQDLGLNWMDFHNRQYDPQLGRFLGIDPLAASTTAMSPYTGMNNNPVSVADPLGLQGINYLAARLQYELYPSRLGPDKGNSGSEGPGSERQKASLQAEDEARYEAAMKALFGKIKGTSFANEPFNMEEMADIAQSKPGSKVNQQGEIGVALLPAVQLYGARSGSGEKYAAWHLWGAKVNDWYGQSLGYDFRGFGLTRADFFADGVRGGMISSVEGVKNLFTWKGLVSFSQNINGPIPDVIGAGKRAIALAKEMSTYNDYDWCYGAGYVTEKVGEIALLSLLGGGSTTAAEVEAAEGGTTTALTKYWPANGGAMGEWSTVMAEEGQIMSRYGVAEGTYASPVGTPFNMRSLSPGTSAADYMEFQVLKPFPMKSSTVAPAFGQPGLGIQYQMPVGINYLEKLGYIKIN